MLFGFRYYYHYIKTPTKLIGKENEISLLNAELAGCSIQSVEGGEDAL